MFQMSYIKKSVVNTFRKLDNTKIWYANLVPHLMTFETIVPHQMTISYWSNIF